MAIADLLNEAMIEQNKLCSMGKILEALDKKDKDAIDKAAANGVSGWAIFNALKQEGYKISNNTFYQHSRGKCRCPKK
jgi:hypothetical protein